MLVLNADDPQLRARGRRARTAFSAGVRPLVGLALMSAQSLERRAPDVRRLRSAHGRLLLSTMAASTTSDWSRPFTLTIVGIAAYKRGHLAAAAVTQWRSDSRRRRSVRFRPVWNPAHGQSCRMMPYVAGAGADRLCPQSRGLRGLCLWPNICARIARLCRCWPRGAPPGAYIGNWPGSPPRSGPGSRGGDGTTRSCAAGAPFDYPGSGCTTERWASLLPPPVCTRGRG